MSRISSFNWDVLVVGSGPAGSSAARAAALKGARVLMVERKSRVGTPVQCAEYIPSMLKGELGLGSDYVVQKTEGMRTFLPGQPVKEMVAPGVIIRRELFDQTLADAALAAGATLRCATRAAALDPEGHVTLFPEEGAPYTIRPRVIVGADGPRSTVGCWMGATNRHLLPGVQMTLPLITPLTHTEIYFDPEITAGYGWLFPKGEVANVGLGMRRPARETPSIRKVLEGFISRLEAKGKIRGAAVAHAAGWIPVEPLRNAVFGNVMLAGDAAGQTHPITGAGTFTAVTCGSLAGDYAAQAAAEDDTKLLKGYDREWQELFGQPLGRARRRRELMEENWDNFDSIIRQCWVAFREYYVDM